MRSKSGVGVFVAAFCSFSPNFLLLLFCRNICNGSDSFPITPLGVCLLMECGSFFTYWNSDCFFFPHIYTSFHPLNLSATPITRFWFISVFYGCSWCSPWDPRAVTGFGAKEGWMKALPLKMCFVTPASVIWEGTIKTLSWIQTERPDSFVILKAQLLGKTLVVVLRFTGRLYSGEHLKFSAETIYAALSPCATPLLIFEASSVCQSGTNVPPGPFHRDKGAGEWAPRFNLRHQL